MEEGTLHGWLVPLKTPAAKVIDLVSDEEVLAEPANATEDGCDAFDEGESQAESDESLWEDIINAEEEEGLLFDGAEGTCTPEEALAFRKQLKAVGEDKFLADTIESGVITAKKLCTAFSIRPPYFLEGQPDEAFYIPLHIGIIRELNKREKLQEYNTIDDAVSLLQKSKNIIVLTGAGISTSLGIPDFRSKETGLYSQLERLGLADPQEVFDISLFKEDPTIFYSVAKDILPSSKRFSPTHAFIKLLQDKEKLLTNFTQNIDNLEECAGISADKLVQCHGSFATATCVECAYHVPCEEIYYDLKAGRVARCVQCIQRIRDVVKPGLKRKRSSEGSSSSKARKKRQRSYEDSTDDDDEDDDIAVAGVMKPDITFFGESLPQKFHSRLTTHDLPLVDLVLVIGTSLKVAPVSEVSSVIPKNVPQIYISREPCNHIRFDIDLLGDCDVVVAELCRRAGWELSHEMVEVERGVDVQDWEEGKEEGWESSRWKVSVVK